jgi:hypothetical protein
MPDAGRHHAARSVYGNRLNGRVVCQALAHTRQEIPTPPTMQTMLNQLRLLAINTIL